MIRRPPRSTRTDTLFPYTTLFRRKQQIMGILSGYRVLDCSIAMAGPFAAQRLGDLGADVVKVEPVGGEWQRHASAGGARGNRINVSFLSLNRNKRSLARSEEHTSELQSLMRLSYAVFCLK